MSKEKDPDFVLNDDDVDTAEEYDENIIVHTSPEKSRQKINLRKNKLRKKRKKNEGLFKRPFQEIKKNLSVVMKKKIPNSPRKGSIKPTDEEKEEIENEIAKLRKRFDKIDSLDLEIKVV